MGDSSCHSLNVISGDRGTSAGLRIAASRLFALLVLILIASARGEESPKPPAPTHPRILFFWDDLPKLQARLSTPEGEYAWKRLKLFCAASTDPKNGLVEFLKTPDGELLGKLELQQKVFRGIYFNALAYITSGQKDYGYNARNLLMKLLRVYPWDGLDWAEGRSSMAILALVYDWIFPLLKQGEIVEVHNVIVKACRRSYLDWKKNWNRFSSVLEASAYDTRLPILAARLGLCALVLERNSYADLEEGEIPEEVKWAQRAIEIVKNYLRAGVSSEGAFHSDVTTPLYKMDEVALFIHAMQLRHVPIFTEPHLQNIGEWIIQETYPWPYDLGYGDGSQSGLAAGSFLALIAHRHGGHAIAAYGNAYQLDGGLGIEPDPLASFIWPSRTEEEMKNQNVSPIALNRHYATTGDIFLRSGWKPEDVSLRITASQVAQPNADGSQGSFTLHGRGAHLVTDTGHLERAAMSYSNVMISGRGQAVFPYGGTEASIRSYIESQPCALVRIDLKQPFDSILRRNPETGELERKEHLRVAKAERTFLFTRKDDIPYLIVFDDFKKDAHERVYDMNIHAPRGSQIYRNRKDARWDWMFIQEPYGGPYLSCNRGTDGGRVRFEFKVLSSGNYWGWMLHRGTMPDGTLGRDLWPLNGEREVAPHPSSSSWTWGKIHFNKEATGLPLTPGGKDLFVSGNQGTWVAGCMLTPSKEFVPQTMESQPREGSVLLTPESAQVTPPWKRGQGMPTAARLNMIMLEPRESELSTTAVQPRIDYPILQNRTKNTEGRFVSILIPGDTLVPLPAILDRKVSIWGSLIKLEWGGGEKNPLGRRMVDTIHFSRQELTRDKDFKTDAKVALFRQYTDQRGGFGMLAMSQGTFVEIQTVRYVDSFGTPFSMIDDGYTIQVSGTKLTKLRVYMESPRRVLLNGKDVRYTLDRKGYAHVKIGNTVVPEIDFEEIE